MTKRLTPGIGKTRSTGTGVLERDYVNGSRSRGFHQGQRACEPHSKAEHMSAPIELVAIAKKHLANRGPSTHVTGLCPYGN